MLPLSASDAMSMLNGQRRLGDVSDIKGISCKSGVLILTELINLSSDCKRT